MNEVMEGLKQLFLTVLTFSAYAAAIAFVVMAVRALLGKKLPALFSCALWGIVMLRLLLPVPLPLPSVFDMMPVSAAQNVIAPGIQSTPDSVDMKDLSEATANRYEPLQQQNARVHAGQYTDSTKSIQTRSFDAIAVAAMLWFAGIFVLVVRTTVVYAISRRKLNSAMPLGRSGFVSLCAAQMGTRYTGDMYLSDVSRVPVLFGLLHPRIILPASAARMTDEELKHVVLHELAHKKRGDMGVKALWSLLLFVNWFNPVLWLADRLLARDIECACDEKVIRILGPESKKAYALSLLNAALDSNPKAETNETLAFAKGGVKHRIENVLNFKKAGRAVTAVSLAIVLLLSAALLTACQPTPEKPVVMGKADNTLESALAATAVPTDSPAQSDETDSAAHMITKEHWTDSTASKLTTVTIDADVFVPNVSAYPVFEVAPIVVDRQLAEKFVNYASKDAIEIHNGDSSSKDNLEEGIVWLQNQITKTKAGHQDPDDELTIEERLASLNKQLEECQAEYAKVIAEGDTTGDPLDYTFEPELGFPERTQVCFTAEMKDGSSRLIRFERCNDGGGPTFSLLSVMDVDTFMQRQGKPVSSEEARKAATAAVDALDIGQFVLARESENGLNNELVFYKLYDGIPVTSIPASQGNSSGVCTEEELTYNFVLWDEILRVYVNNTGVILIEWTSPCDVIRTVNENVELKPFDEIKQIFKQQILYHVYEEDGKADTLKINQVRLGYMAVPEKGDISNYRMIPVWDFIGPSFSDEEYAKITDPKNNEEGATVIPNEDISYLTVNAIDGSIIDRNLGY